MTRSVRSRALATPLALALALTMTLSACSSDDPEPGPTAPATPTDLATTSTPTTSPVHSPTQTPTAAPTTATAPAPTTGSPTSAAPTAAPGTPTPARTGDAAALAAFLPDGFPVPDEVTITGDPTRTPQQSSVKFTVPAPAETFDFYKSELPKAGYTLLPGTSDAYSPEVASGAILGESDDYRLNLLIVDDEVEIVLDYR